MATKGRYKDVGVGTSIVRFTALCVLCLVAAECQAGSGNPGNQHVRNVDSSTEGNALEKRSFDSDGGLVKSRPRRNTVHAVEPRADLSKIAKLFKSSGVPGIKEGRFAINSSLLHADGKDCQTGQDPFNPNEFEILHDFMITIIKKYVKEQEMEFSFYSFTASETLAKSFSGGCLSGECHFHSLLTSNVCGPVPKYSFEKETSCVDGKYPQTEAAITENGDPTSPAHIQENNEKMTSEWGHQCKSGKCILDPHELSLICGQPSSQTPSNLIALLLPALWLLQMAMR